MTNPLCAQCVFFRSHFLEIFVYLAQTLSTRAFFYLCRTLACGWRLSEKQNNKRAPEVFKQDTKILMQVNFENFHFEPPRYLPLEAQLSKIESTVDI